MTARLARIRRVNGKRPATADAQIRVRTVPATSEQADRIAALIVEILDRDAARGGT